MKFEEALKALREGKKIRHGKCRCYIKYDKSTLQNLVDAMDDCARIDSYELGSDKWEIVDD